MLPIKKIYIDSRFKSSDSASDSDFKIDLPISFLMPEDTSNVTVGIKLEYNNIVSFGNWVPGVWDANVVYVKAGAFKH